MRPSKQARLELKEEMLASLHTTDYVLDTDLLDVMVVAPPRITL